MKTINHECYVSPEVAKLLKEAGFDWEEHYPRNFCYINDNTELFDKSVLKNYIGEDDVIYLAPTAEVAQRWLREVKGIEVYAHVFYDSREMLDELDVYVYEVNHITKHIEDYISSYDIYHTYEEAQEAGIKNVLEILLEKGE